MSYFKRGLWFIGFSLLFVPLMACSSESPVPIGNESSEKVVGSSSLQTNRASVRQSDVIKNADKQGRKITYKATVSIDIKDYQKARNQIGKLVSQAQGYMVDSTEYQSQNRKQVGNFVYRIPQKNFDSFINNMKKMSLDGGIRQITIKGNDVTEEIVDLNARLKAKRATEKRLFELMNKTTDSHSLLRISEQLDRVQGEIERIEGKLKYLNHRVDFSEVVIHLRQEEVLPAPDNASMGQKMKEAFLNSVIAIVNVGKILLIFFAGAIPVLIVLSLIGIPIYLIIRRYIKRKS